MIPVVLKFSLVGRTLKNEEYPVTNKEKFEDMMDQVYAQFGIRNSVVVNEKTLLTERVSFPDFYAAGWFVSEEKNGSDLVVIGCGESMRSAQSKVLKKVVLVDWGAEASLVWE